MLKLDRKKQNSVKQLSLNKKLNLKKLYYTIDYFFFFFFDYFFLESITHELKLIY